MTKAQWYIINNPYDFNEYFTNVSLEIVNENLLDEDEVIDHVLRCKIMMICWYRENKSM